MSTNAQASMATIGAFIQEVGAAEKRAAEAHTEPGSQGGATEHPVKNVDDRCDPAKEGERSAENEADVKKDQGASGVDGTPEAKAAADGTSSSSKSRGGAVQTPGSAADDHYQQGTNVQATGEDKSVETSSAKSGKEDEGHQEDSSHPARTDNDDLDGHKYSADQLGGMDLSRLASITKKAADDLCALIAGASPDSSSTREGQYKLASDPFGGDPDLSHQAGWELAGLFAGDFDKQAADQLVVETLKETIKVASDDADRVLVFLAEANNTLEKGAEMPMEDPAAAMAPPGGGIPMGGGDDEMGDEMGGEMGGEDEAALMDALGGGEAPEEEGLGGAEDEAMQLAEILQELGVSPEELEAAMAAEAGPEAGMGAEGPPPGGMGGMGGMEAMAADKEAIRKQARDYVREIIQRSRRKA